MPVLSSLICKELSKNFTAIHYRSGEIIDINNNSLVCLKTGKVAPIPARGKKYR